MIKILKKRTKISFLQKFERFFYLKKIFNKNELNYADSPIGFLDFNENKFNLSVSKNDINKEKIDEKFEYFLTNGKITLIDNLFEKKDDSYDYKDLFNIKIMLEKTNENLINLLKAIPKSLEKVKKIEKKEDNNDNIDEQKKYRIIGEKQNRIDKNGILDKYIKEKNKMINESTFRKFTFERNTIVGYTYDFANHKFIPDK